MGVCGYGGDVARVLGDGTKLESRDIFRKFAARGQEKSDGHHELGAMFRRLYQRDGIKKTEAVPEMLAYLVCILRTGQDFGGLAWVNYDSAFRRQAAATGNRQWSRVNPSLYSICFAGVARSSVRCDLCLSLHHHSKDCAMVADADPDVGSQLKAVESAVLVLAQPRWQMPSPTGPTGGRGGGRQPNPAVISTGAGALSGGAAIDTYAGCQGPQPASECCEKAALRGSPPEGLPRGAHTQMAWLRRARDV